MRFYSHFNLAMDRSPGFGSTSCNFSPSSDSLSLRLRSSQILTLPHNVTRRSVLQKVQGRTFIVLPLLVNTGFQVLFHSPPGVLFTFPSRYSFTIGYQVVFSLTGWSPLFHTRFPVSRTTLDSTYPNLSFIYWTFTVFGSPSQMILLDLLVVYGSPYPICISTYGLGSFWFARHYYRNHCLFSLPMGT